MSCESFPLKCNSCWKSLPRAGYATRCLHVFCAECASQALHDGACSACQTSVDQNSVHEIIDDTRVAIGRLQGQTVATLMRCTQAALVFINYQKSICAAKSRQDEKRRVKGILENSRQKVDQFLKGYTKVRDKCEATLLQHAEAEEERLALEQHFNDKASKLQKLQADAKRLRAEISTVSDTGSEAASDDGWFETVLEHELRIEAPPPKRQALLSAADKREIFGASPARPLLPTPCPSSRRLPATDAEARQRSSLDQQPAPGALMLPVSLGAELGAMNVLAGPGGHGGRAPLRGLTPQTLDGRTRLAPQLPQGQPGAASLKSMLGTRLRLS